MRRCIFSLLLTFQLQAVSLSDCVGAVERFFSRPIMPYSKTEFEAINQAIKEVEIPRVSLVNKSGEENYYVYSLFPDDVKVILLNMPDDPKGIQSYRRVLLDELKVGISHPVFEIMEHILRNKRSDTPQEYLGKAKKHFENLLESERVGIKIKYDYIFNLERARTFVRKVTSVEIPVVKEGRKTYLQIGTDKYPAKEKRDHWLVTVPHDRVKTPAWNPMEREKTERVIREGRRLNAYTTSIDLDGNFYLQDGNHRFQFLEHRNFVKVKINKERKTGSIRDLIINLGGHDLTDDEYLRIHRGEAVKDVINQSLALRLIFDFDYNP